MSDDQFKHIVVDEGYLHTVRPLSHQAGGVSYGQARAYAHFTGALARANAEWDALVDDDEDLQFYDDWYAASMVVSIGGMPAVLVASVDDFPQAFPFEAPIKMNKEEE